MNSSSSSAIYLCNRKEQFLLPQFHVILGDNNNCILMLNKLSIPLFKLQCDFLDRLTTTKSPTASFSCRIYVLRESLQSTAMSLYNGFVGCKNVNKC